MERTNSIELGIRRASALVVLGAFASAGCVAGLAGCGGAQSASDAPDGPSIVVTAAMGHPHVGDPAPDFELTDAEGHPFRLSSLRGQVVALSFVTSWCPFSQAEQPFLAQLGRDLGSRARFVTVDLDETDAGYQRYVARRPMPFPVLHDTMGAHVGAFVPSNPPVHFAPRNRWKIIVTANVVLDREGRIVFFTLADLSHFDAELVHMRHALDSALAAAAAPH